MSVYIVRAEGLDLVKIGYSRTPIVRLADLQTGSPVSLSLVALIPADKSCERMLHTRLARHHSHGEWFKKTQEVDDLITAFGCEHSAQLVVAATKRGLKQGLLPKGVQKHRRRFRAQLSIGGKLIRIGSYATVSEARAAYENAICSLEPHPHSAPRSSQQPTLARGCEAEPAANCSSVERRGDTRMHTTLRMVRKGEIFTAVHGETCA